MWIFTPIGGYSIVQKPGQTRLTVRSRTRGDLVRLHRAMHGARCRCLPIETDFRADYPFRMRVLRGDLAKTVAGLIQDIRYPNVKDEVTRVLGPDRAWEYGAIWAAWADAARATLDFCLQRGKLWVERGGPHGD